METGTNWGLSTIVLAQALIDSGYKGHVHSIDINPEFIEKTKQNISKTNLSNYISLYCKDSALYLETLLEEISKPIRFAFLDRNHSTENVIFEFELISKYLHSDGIIFFDNTSHSPDNPRQGVYEALQYIKENHKGSLINFTNTSWYPPGQAIWQKNPL